MGRTVKFEPSAGWARTLKAIADYQAETGWYPSVRELGKRLGLKSPSSVHWYVERLVEDGLVEQNSTHSQMRITAKGREMLASLNGEVLNGS